MGNAVFVLELPSETASAVCVPGRNRYQVKQNLNTFGFQMTGGQGNGWQVLVSEVSKQQPCAIIRARHSLQTKKKKTKAKKPKSNL